MTGRWPRMMACCQKKPGSCNDWSLAIKKFIGHSATTKDKRAIERRLGMFGWYGSWDSCKLLKLVRDHATEQQEAR